MSETLKDEIAKLEALRQRLRKARQIPPGVLQNMRGSEKVGEAFAELKEIGEVLGSDEVQKALSRARDSLDADGGGLGTEDRRQPKRKRSRAASPEGYVEEKQKGRSSLLPSCEEEAVTMDGLGAWAREYNAGHAHKLRIRDRMLRMAIADVMTVYMGLGRGDGGRAVVETIRAFGPREKGDGHGESRYTVYQQVTQQLHALLEEEGLERVKLQTVVALVESYEDLFVGRCGECERVVSAEGHVPGVCRGWTGGGWRKRHIGCAIGGQWSD